MLLIQLIFNGIIRGGIYALVAMGFVLIYRGTKVFHIAHGAIYTLGAYCFFTFARLLNLNLAFSIFFTLICTIFVGLLIEELVYYPLFKKKASPLVIIIVSLGVYILLTNLIALFYGNETRVILIMLNKRLNIGMLTLTSTQIIQFLVKINRFLTKIWKSKCTF